MWACARGWTKQPVLRINTMIQHINTSVFICDSRSVFVVVVLQSLEGERYDGERALATQTFQKSHVRIGVVDMVLVSVKSARFENYVFVLQKFEKG